jgi:hypothetical protein
MFFDYLFGTGKIINVLDELQIFAELVMIFSMIQFVIIVWAILDILIKNKEV